MLGSGLTVVDRRRGQPKRCRSFILGALIAILSAQGCDDAVVVNLNCPDRGCASGLRVVFDGLEGGEVEVTALVPGLPPQRLGCDGQGCASGVVFEGYRPDTVTIRVRTASSTVEERFIPRYEPVYANGKECGVTCIVGTVRIRVLR